MKITTVIIISLIFALLLSHSAGIVGRLVSEDERGWRISASLTQQAGAMDSGGNALTDAAEQMEQAADTIDATTENDQLGVLSDLAERWHAEAADLQRRSTSLEMSTSADSMVHDPDRAHQFDLRNLQGNGSMMTSIGRQMIEHGNRMHEDIETLRKSGLIDSDTLETLASSADEIVVTGSNLEREGLRMEEYASNFSPAQEI